MTLVQRKAFAYVTHGSRLLVLVHPDYPEAGIQVPAGTLRDGETPADGVLREAWEETGLEGLRVVAFLGEQAIDAISYEGEAQVHRRFFYHLHCAGEPPETWRHQELHDGLGPPTAFDFYWASLPDGLPKLIAGHDRYLPELLRSMRLSKQK